MPNYWIAKVSDDYWFDQALEKGVWCTQKRYGSQTTQTVTTIWSTIGCVQVGDVLLLSYHGDIHAFGVVEPCPYASDQIDSIEHTTKHHRHKFNSGIVIFSDSKVVFDDLRTSDSHWGERISVGHWQCYCNPTSVNTSGITQYVRKSDARQSFYNIPESYGQELVKKLERQYNKHNMETSKIASLLRLKGNIILQGAPGTGKTYSTAAVALHTLGQTDIDLSDHAAVMKRYEELLGKQIFFTTFHQSLDYEDFVEGLRPVVQHDASGNAVGVCYQPKDGIFKQACAAVDTEIGADTDDLIDDFLNNKINGVENKREIQSLTGKSSFYAWWKLGNTTVSTMSTKSGKTPGVDPVPAPLNIDRIKAQARGEGQEPSWPYYAQAFIEEVRREYTQTKDKPVVLIIDEINRGNVSKIFGELITLIEADKRLDSSHPTKTTLPYSGTSFGVPRNLYIIGTMNTTDRSTGTLDYALRRRFAFVTLTADRKVLEKHYAADPTTGQVALALFDDIKQFVKSHASADTDITDLMPGHSYFMARTSDELQLKLEFEALPLISEYITDGLLNVDSNDKNKAFDAWAKLQTI